MVTSSMRRTLCGIFSDGVSFTILIALVVIGLHVALERGALTARIEPVLQQALGRPVILGAISLHPALLSVVSVRDVMIANLAGGSRPEFARIDRIDFELALLPLVDGRIEIGALVVSGADILLERNGQGRPNWHLGSQTTIGSDTAEPDARNLSIGNVQFEHARLRFANDPAVNIEVPALALGSLDSSGTRTLSGTIKVAGESIDLTAAIRPQADLPLQLHATLSLVDATLTAQGSVALGGPSEPDWSLSLAGTAEDPQRLVSLLPDSPRIPAVGPSTFAFRLGPGAPYPVITDVELHTGAVDLVPWLPGLRLNSAEIAAPAMDKPITLSAMADRSGVPLAVSATLGPPVLLLANDRPLPVDARLTGAGAALILKGAMTRPFGTFGTEFDAALTAANLASLSPLLGRELPNLRDVKAGAHIEQTGPASFSLQGLSLSADSVDVSGDLQIDATRHPSLRGRIAARQLDLDELMGALAGPAATARARSSHVIPDIALPLATLRSFDATLAFSADAIQAGGVLWRAVAGNLALNRGQLTVTPLTGTTAGGSLRGRASLDAASTPSTASLFVRNEEPGFNFTSLRRAIGSKSGIEGLAEITLDLKGQAATTRTFTETLSGDVGIAMVGGRLLGVAPISVGPDLSRLLLPRGTPKGGVAIDCLAIRLSATDGIVRSLALLLEGPDMRVDGNLAIDLRDEMLVMRLLPDIRVLGVTVRAPVAIEGSLAAPRVEAEPAAAFTRLMIDTIANRLWKSSAVEWLQRRGGGAPGAHTCTAQLRLARLGRNGPVPKPPALLPGLPKELQGAVRNTVRGIGNIFRGRGSTTN
jgi:uncharacterized protein involved in outer membrane biogenesis